MPHVIVKLLAGRSEEQKRRLADAITNEVMSVLGSEEDSISVAFEDVLSKDWTEKVYKPDIEAKWDQVYKKPGYEPF